jgi:hypothetical protein
MIGECIPIMSNKDSTMQQNIGDSTCEAVGCYSKASIEIHLKVGTKGMIPLFLCANCTPKLCPDDNNCVNLRTDV